MGSESSAPVVCSFRVSLVALAVPRTILEILSATSACIPGRNFSIRSFLQTSTPSHRTISTVSSFAVSRTLPSFESNMWAMPFNIGFAGITVGVPNDDKHFKSASTDASASFGTLCWVPFNRASTTTSATSSSHSTKHTSVALSTVLARPFMPLLTTLAIIDAACALAYPSSATPQNARSASRPKSKAFAFVSPAACFATEPGVKRRRTVEKYAWSQSQ